MPIDFRAKIKSGLKEKKENPIEIYDSLDRTSAAGPLRQSQIEVLNEWFFNHRNSRDLVIKLHTGEGKTLIGLLILMSKLNEGKGPCLYICPNKNLVSQACKEAVKFGVPICTIGDNNMLPNEFLNGQRILVTHVQKVFNGKSIFGIGYNSCKAGTVVLDDAHACLDSIRDAYVISIKRKDYPKLYLKILSLFENDLREQGAGTFFDIKENENIDSIMEIPYWAWIDKCNEVLSLLGRYTNEQFLMFAWGLDRDLLPKCQAFVSGNEIQIMPIATQIEMFGTFHGAETRIIMSATTQDDVFFVKTLDFDVSAVNNPIKTSSHKWSGEKMILIPSLISDNLSREAIVNAFSKQNWNKFGVVSIVPSNKKLKDYENNGGIIVDKERIDAELNKLREGKFSKIVVLANRYDGIDLPDSACRILIIDSMPFFSNMSDIYEGKCRAGSDYICKKYAQKVEQGMGRCVRSEKDYACILIIGAELVNFIRNNQTQKYFSKQTKKQVELGLEMAEWSREDASEESITKITSLINQCLHRDEGWKEFYKSEMDDFEEAQVESSVNIDVLVLEKKAEECFLKNKYEEAANYIQKILDMDFISESEAGWYLQEKAKYIYPLNKLESVKLQKAAFEHNYMLLKPIEGIVYKKFERIDTDRLRKLQDVLTSFDSYEEMMLKVNSIYENLSFGVEAEKFELAIDQLGCMLGFETQRPDKMIRKGPDNLWKIGRDNYILIECKSEVLETREYITKTEVGQMNNHCAWFEREYPHADVKRIIITPTSKVAYEGDFSHDVYVVTRNELDGLKTQFRNFFLGLKQYDLKNIDSSIIEQLINASKIDKKSIINSYAIPYQR